MKQSIIIAITAVAVSTAFAGCEKEDKDAIEMSILKKGVQTFEAADGKQYEVVDLGFSGAGLLWATCNLGADSPEQFGDYFAWGETEAKTTFTYDNYKWMNGANSFKKYCLKKEERDLRKDTVDNKRILDLTDDAVRAKLGDKWRMPSTEDYKELFDRCDWRCCKLNNVWGYLFKSKENGNSIFLPIAGFTDESDNFFIGKRGRYWTTSLSSNSTTEAVYVSLDKPVNPVTRTDERYLGFSIRPVRAK